MPLVTRFPVLLSLPLAYSCYYFHASLPFCPKFCQYLIKRKMASYHKFCHYYHKFNLSSLPRFLGSFQYGLWQLGQTFVSLSGLRGYHLCPHREQWNVVTSSFSLYDILPVYHYKYMLSSISSQINYLKYIANKYWQRLLLWRATGVVRPSYGTERTNTLCMWLLLNCQRT